MSESKSKWLCTAFEAMRATPPPELSEQDKARIDMLLYGKSVMVDGKRVDPKDFSIVTEPRP